MYPIWYRPYNSGTSIVNIANIFIDYIRYDMYNIADFRYYGTSAATDTNSEILNLKGFDF